MDILKIFDTETYKKKIDFIRHFGTSSEVNKINEIIVCIIC